MKPDVVSVFGGSLIRPGSPAYEEAYTLGRLLAQAGYIVMNGGYDGTMEATAKGAKSADGYVIGVTFNRHATLHPANPNPYNDEIIRYNTLRERISHLVTKCDAAVALRGGIGTLTEVAVTWSLLQVGEIKSKPFVLLGKEWEDLLTHYYGDGAYIREANMQLWKVAYTPEDVLSLLQKWE